jgi:hypothetical protein
MNDYDAIKETVFHYYEGYRDKNRERLEKAFSLESFEYSVVFAYGLLLRLKGIIFRGLVAQIRHRKFHRSVYITCLMPGL